MEETWQKKVEDYCKKYNIPIFFLAETMYEPKVVPMIRGKAFEFSVFEILKKTLPNSIWDVSKPPINAQIGLHDIDVKVTHKRTNKVIRIECKLAKKGGFRLFDDGHAEIRVKCMRSRTLGPAKVKELAPKLGVNAKVLSIHNDQYLPTDFDVVITSIANAFYRTDPQTGYFEWKPSGEGKSFLNKIGYNGASDLKDFAFSQLYLAHTKDLVIGHDSRVVCTRGRCLNKKNCGFIPNYPIITFDSRTNKPTNGWVSIVDSILFFEKLIGLK